MGDDQTMQSGEPVEPAPPETDNSPRPEDGEQDVSQDPAPVDGSETVEA